MSLGALFSKFGEIKKESLYRHTSQHASKPNQNMV